MQAPGRDQVMPKSHHKPAPQARQTHSLATSTGLYATLDRNAAKQQTVGAHTQPVGFQSAASARQPEGHAPVAISATKPIPTAQARIAASQASKSKGDVQQNPFKIMYFQQQNFIQNRLVSFSLLKIIFKNLNYFVLGPTTTAPCWFGHRGSRSRSCRRRQQDSKSNQRTIRPSPSCLWPYSRRGPISLRRHVTEGSS